MHFLCRSVLNLKAIAKKTRRNINFVCDPHLTYPSPCRLQTAFLSFFFRIFTSQGISKKDSATVDDEIQLKKSVVCRAPYSLICCEPTDLSHHIPGSTCGFIKRRASASTKNTHVRICWSTMSAEESTTIEI